MCVCVCGSDDNRQWQNRWLVIHIFRCCSFRFYSRKQHTGNIFLSPWLSLIPRSFPPPYLSLFIFVSPSVCLLSPTLSISLSACGGIESNQSIQVSWADQWCGKKLTFRFLLCVCVRAPVCVCTPSRGKQLELSRYLPLSWWCHPVWRCPQLATKDCANTHKQHAQTHTALADMTSTRTVDTALARLCVFL